MSFDIELGIHTVNQSRRRPDALTQHTIHMADDAAANMRAEFGDSLDMEMCGKAWLIIAAAVIPLCDPEIPGAVLANLIAFAGENLIRTARSTVTP